MYLSALSTGMVKSDSFFRLRTGESLDKKLKIFYGILLTSLGRYTAPCSKSFPSSCLHTAGIKTLTMKSPEAETPSLVASHVNVPRSLAPASSIVNISLGN